MRWVALLAGCGRLGFDDVTPIRGDGNRGDGFGSDTVTVAVCGDSDGVCPPACPTGDADCVNVCGDSRCVGNAGELCAMCADCAIPAGCGNGACEPDEDGASCYADCGPAPWMWTSEEAGLEAAINNARVGGVSCPGDSSPRFAPALTVSNNTALRIGAREYAWEIAHQQYYMGSGISCNGRTFAERQADHGTTGGGLSFAATVSSTYADVIASWSANASACPVLMATNRTKFAAGVAYDGWYGYVFWFE